MRTSPDNTHSDCRHSDSTRSDNGHTPFDSILFDSASDPFLSDLNWSTQELIDAVRWSPPLLHRFDFSPSANDAATHRPRRGGSFLAMPQLPSRFRIGG